MKYIKTLMFNFFHRGTILTMQANCKINRDVVSEVFVVNDGEKKSTSQTSKYDFLLSLKAA